VDPQTERFDLGKIRELARQCRPKLIIAGASAYPRSIDFAAFAEIAREVGAYLMCDIAHVAGLVAAKLHPDPVPVSDFVTSTTHKTLRGPRGGLILTTSDHARAIDSAVFPGIQGGPLMHVIAAKAIAFGEALRPQFKQYQQAIVNNAATLADELKRLGYRLVADGTDNHLMLVDLRSNFKDLTGDDAQRRLESANIIVNKNLIPFDTRKPMQTSGIRIGTPAATSRGMNADHMKHIARLIDQALRSDEPGSLAPEVRELARQFPIFP
jgi:glycine hydroxymethyltransferase